MVYFMHSPADAKRGDDMGFFSRKQKAPAPQPGRITVSRDASGLLVLKVTGLISPQSVADAQAKILAAAVGGEKLRGLIDAEEFHGWARGFNGGMSEAEKMFSIDDLSDRIAVVADPKFHERLRNFLCIWMRQAKFRFFDVPDRASAMSWLQSKSA